VADFFNDLPYFVTVGKKQYRMTPAYDNILNMYISIDGLSESEKFDVMMYYLFPKHTPKRVDILQAASDVLFAKSKSSETQKAFDYIQDAQYIYAAFMQAYKIDLEEERGIMHWWKFQSLLQGLPSDTKFSEIVQIRLKPMPKPTKNNAQERAELMRLKQIFRLEVSEAERQKNLQDGLKKMAACLMAMRGEKNG
jgi:uncharacterized protein (DUF2225 family)